MKKLTRMKLLGAGLLLGALLGTVPWLINSAEESDRPVLTIKEDMSDLKRTSTGDLPTSYAAIVEKASKAIVNVYSSKVVKNRAAEMHPFFNDPFFRDFFGDSRRHPQPQPRPRQRIQRGLGSGVIISADGYILTNNHVVAGADEIKVALGKDGKREFNATVIGTDPKTDVALLKIDAKDLPAATIADSSKVKVGDIVFAIGNPFGVGQTVTKGIISATGRDIGMVDYEGFLQTDAAINPGNSGGALIDATGRLIGINTAIVSRSGGSQGIGFAIPINMAKRIAKDLIKNGSISRGFLGVGIQDVTPELQEAFGLGTAKGALVTSVMPDSAASQAGVKSGDVIVSFNGKDVENTRKLRFAVAAVPPGETVSLVVVRDGKRLKLSTVLKAMEGSAVAGSGAGSDLLKGVSLSELDDNTRRKHQVSDDVQGVVVTELAADSLAASQNLQVGDVIVEAERKKTTTLEALRNATTGAKERLLLKIWRKGGNLYLVLKKK